MFLASAVDVLKGNYMEYVILAISALSLLIGVIVLCVTIKLKKGKKDVSDDIETYLLGISERLKEIGDGVKKSEYNAEQTARYTLERIADALSQTKRASDEQNLIVKEFLISLKGDVDKRLNEMTTENARKLEEINKTVDENLSKSLQDRLQVAFGSLNDRLDSVQKNFVEVQKLSNEVVKLNGVFSNVKTRGVFGEVTLENIITEILTPEEYYKQKQIKQKDIVDFAVRMPGGGGTELLLPLDAKFPLADYERLTEAFDSRDKEQVDSARKALLTAVKTQAKSIRDKYIDPPLTTDFAVMFLATEGLFAEVAREVGFIEKLRREYKVIPCGPTTVSALLNSLMVGFTTLKIQKKSSEIVALMKGFGKDFEKLLDLIAKIRKSSETISGTLEEIDKRNSIIQKGLKKLELSAEETEELPPDMFDAT